MRKKNSNIRESFGLARRTRLARPGAQLPAAHVFLVRLWRETSDNFDPRPPWRGTVSDIRGHRLGYFGIADELLQHLVDSSEAGTARRNAHGRSQH